LGLLLDYLHAAIFGAPFIKVGAAHAMLKTHKSGIATPAVASFKMSMI
jgi:hypothetical protein